MARTAIGVTLGIAFIAAVVWSALGTSAVTCEICVEYKGRPACSIATAADPDQARAQAQSGACSQVTGGVTETLECAAILPTKQSCQP